MKTMPKTVVEERYRWIRPIINKEIRINQMIDFCPFSERTIKYWLSKYRKQGLNGLKDKTRRPKSNPKDTPIEIKERVFQLRKETDLSAIKLKWKLEKEGIFLHERTIGKFLKNKGLTRKYRTRRIKYKYVRASLNPGELVEIDVKYVPKLLRQKQYYQFTAIDCSSRWRYLKVFEDYSNHSSISFLKNLIAITPFKINAIKTDNGSYFTNRILGYNKSTDPINPRIHSFDLSCKKHNIIHYLIDIGKPQQNGKVERSHRTDQEMFYNRTNFKTVEELKYKLKLWNMFYNNLEHCALNGLTPNQALGLKVQNVLA